MAVIKVPLVAYAEVNVGTTTGTRGRVHLTARAVRIVVETPGGEELLAVNLDDPQGAPDALST